MKCPSCGKEVLNNGSFCVFCGGKLPETPSGNAAGTKLLQCTGGEISGREFPLTRDGLMLGRDPSCQVTIDHPEVSRRHVWVGLDEQNRPSIVDQGSANGTFLNGERVTRAVLSPGDVLAVGVTNRVTFQLKVPAPRPEEIPVSRQSPVARSVAPPVAVQPDRDPVDLANQTIAEAPQFHVGKPRLQLIVDHYVVESYAVNQQGVLIGRDPNTCTILLDHASISRVHARVVYKGGMVILIDEGSANGTFVNGKRIDEHVLSEADRITFGVYHEKSLIFRDSDKGRLKARTLKLDRDTITIGRDPSNDVVLDHPMVSKFHARMMRSNGSFVLSDLGSLNGTFVNNRKITTQPLSARDRIIVGGFELKFDGTQVRHERELLGLAIDAYNIEKRVGQNLLLLDDISLCIQPNEFVGLLGPSGAGKSTLLDALNGFRPATSGQVMVNGLDLYSSFDSLKSMIGYVPQDDIIHKQLSVYKCLYYAARLRLPSDTPESEIVKIIDEVLKILELEERRHTLVTKVSGGQRKRVNIGVELVTKPTLIFLDEPTSGLDPRTEAKMMALFRQLADQGRTVVLTTHVMASLSQLDKIIVLVKGKLAYFGPGVELVDYFDVESPSDIFDRLETTAPPEWKQRYLQSTYVKDYITEPLKQKEQDSARAKPPEGQRAKKRAFSLDQLKVLTRRYTEIKFNDRVFTAILLLQAPLLAGLDILVTTRNGARLLFLVIFGAIWYGFTNATREIVGEQAIYKRERQTGLKVPSYVFSKVVVLAVIALVQCLLTIGTLTFFGQLEGHFLLTLGIMFLTTLNGILLGLLVSALVSSTELAITFGVVALFPQILFAGLLVPINDIQSVLRKDITAREMAELTGRPAPEGALGEVIVRTIEEPVTALEGMSPTVQTLSKLIVTRWGLEALADVYRDDTAVPGDYEGLLAVQNDYRTCLSWLGIIALVVMIMVLLVQKRKDFKT